MGAIICTAIIAMGISVTFCALYGNAMSVLEDPAFACTVQGTDVASRWATAIKLNFWTYLILSVSGLLSMVGACMPVIRKINAAIQGCCLGVLQLAAIIYLGVVRLDQFGQVCADEQNSAQFQLIFETSQFLLNMFISQCCLACCIMTCMSTGAKFK